MKNFSFRLRIFGCVAFLLFLSSCVKKDHFRLTGSFENLRQADLYVYSVDGGLNDIDTISIVENEFKWEKPLARECTYYIIFPNLSEHIVFARPGTHVKIKGDGTALRALEISGTAENDSLTAFRLRHLTASSSQLITAMKAYVKEQPQSIVSGYFRRQINIQKRRSSSLETGKKLPEIELLPDDDTTDTLHIPYKNKNRQTLLVFWASWKRDSKEAFPNIRHAARTSAKAKTRRLSPIFISLDSDTAAYHYTCRIDSINFPSRCTREIWETSVVNQLSVHDLPYYILIDSIGTIRALGSNWKKDIAPKL